MLGYSRARVLRLELSGAWDRARWSLELVLGYSRARVIRLGLSGAWDRGASA